MKTVHGGTRWELAHFLTALATLFVHLANADCQGLPRTVRGIAPQRSLVPCRHREGRGNSSSTMGLREVGLVELTNYMV
jgi:hypothetical protein